ncbi:MAG: VWA domain-containing protein [Myxococcaceae bacterium]|nr:VWA domain-containing protein [Myxococcaceae bacterium]
MRALLVVAAVVGLGCGRTEVVREATVDAPPVDAGAPDAGRPRDAGVDAGAPDAGPLDAGFVPKPCIAGTFTLSPAEPVVMLVLDRSGSMDLVFSNGVTRWDALVGSLRATLPAVNQTMQVGGLAFPTNTVDECLVPDTSGVWPSRGNVPLLLSTLESIRPSGATPTADALRVASQVLRGRRAGNAARAMVLATDGAPTCGSAPFDSTLVRLRQAASEGIPTYVIGIADQPSLRAALQQMAVAGQRPRPGPQGFYSAQSVAELQLAFGTIRDQVGACSFLTNSVPDARGTIVVTLDGVNVPQDDTGLRGWRWTDRENGELALVGSVCERAVARPASVIVTVACGGP